LQKEKSTQKVSEPLIW